jgi:hypothetical protein
MARRSSKYRRHREYSIPVVKGEPTPQQRFKFSLRRKAIREYNDDWFRDNPEAACRHMLRSGDCGGGSRPPCKTGRLDGRYVPGRIEYVPPSWENAVREYEDLDRYRNFGF